MKVTNIGNKTVYLKDLRLIRQGQTEARRSEDQYLQPGHSTYLPDTSDVIRSAQKGDLFKLQKIGLVRLNDTTILQGYPGPGNYVIIDHGLGYIPIVVILKKVIVGSVVTWVDASGSLDLIHNSDFTSITITNTVGLPIEFLTRVG